MPVIHLVGPNAIGKTTAVVRWAQRYGGLKTISLDLLRKAGYDTSQEKRDRVKEWKEAPVITVVESARTTQLTVVSCDSSGQGVVLERGTRILSELRWKGTPQEKQHAVELVRKRFPIVVCESARTTTTNHALVDEPVIIVTCSWTLMEKHMRARCLAKNKTYREDYWTRVKLEYESSKRYLNFAQKSLSPDQCKIFEIRDQEKDWEVIDEYFYSLYRSLHNKLVRQAKAKGE